MVESDFLMLLEVTTVMYCGTLLGGFELLPGRVVQVAPHLGG